MNVTEHFALKRRQRCPTCRAAAPRHVLGCAARSKAIQDRAVELFKDEIAAGRAWCHCGPESFELGHFEDCTYSLALDKALGRAELEFDMRGMS